MTDIHSSVRAAAAPPQGGCAASPPMFQCAMLSHLLAVTPAGGPTREDADSGVVAPHSNDAK